MPEIDDDQVRKDDWEAIRAAGLRALREDLAMASHLSMFSMIGDERRVTIERRIKLLETTQFLSLKEP